MIGKAAFEEIISVDPDRMSGTPCFRGTRVPVELLLRDLQEGLMIDDFLEDRPAVAREQVVRLLELFTRGVLAA